MSSQIFERICALNNVGDAPRGVIMGFLLAPYSRRGGGVPGRWRQDERLDGRERYPGFLGVIGTLLGLCSGAVFGGGDVRSEAKTI